MLRQKEFAKKVGVVKGFLEKDNGSWLHRIAKESKLKCSKAWIYDKYSTPRIIFKARFSTF